MFLSPGPGSPTDFKLSTTIKMAQRRNLPIFGVCLGARLLSLEPAMLPLTGSAHGVSQVCKALLSISEESSAN